MRRCRGGRCAEGVEEVWRGEEVWRRYVVWRREVVWGVRRCGGGRCAEGVEGGGGGGVWREA